MAGSTSKKVIAFRFDREPLPGFVDPQGFLQTGGIELMTTSGGVVILPYPDVKALCFVRDFEPGAVWRENRSFSNRPKTEGLWLRLRFRDGDSIEGLIANNLLSFEPAGFALSPPDAGIQNQRLFVPRAALTGVQVLGVVGSPLRRTAKGKSGGKDQLRMFE